MSLIAIVHQQHLFKIRYWSALPDSKWKNASINFENGRKWRFFDPIFTFVPGSSRGKHFKRKKWSFYYQLAALFPTVKSKTKSENHEVPAILKKRGFLIDPLLNWKVNYLHWCLFSVSVSKSIQEHKTCEQN